MTDTKALIARLTREAHKVTPIKAPSYLAACLIGILFTYGVAIQFFMGVRPDLAMQLSRPYFLFEILLLSVLLVTSIVASVLAMTPDSYQKTKLLILPYGVFLLLALLIVIQLFLPQDARMVIPRTGTHTIECALCIAVVALIPSAVIFALLRNGASVRQYQLGSFALLAASSVGCLTLRLAEPTDSMQHLLLWHYVPTLLFSALGACIGKWLLRW